MADATIAESLDEILRTRRSIRAYKPGPIDRAEVARLLEVAARAPSAWNSQPWRFVAVDDPETKARLQTAARNQPQVGNAPVVVAIYGDMVDFIEKIDAVFHPSMPDGAKAALKGNIFGFLGSLTDPQRDQWGRSQAYIVLGYLLAVLAAHDYGSSPMVEFDPAQVREVLDLPPHAEVAALVAFGLPAEEGRPSVRHEIGSILRWAGPSPA